MEKPRELRKVPLQFSWLSENDLLVEACRLAGVEIDLRTAGPEGVSGISWDAYLHLTTDQLKELGFE